MKKIWCFAVVIILFMVNTIPLSTYGSNEPKDWSEAIRLTFTDGRSLVPDIAVEGNNVHVVYADNEGAGKYTSFLWYINSSDYGKTWNSPICLTNNSPISVSSPKIAVYENNIHIIWLDLSQKRIHYIRSLDNGINWSDETLSDPNIFPNLSFLDIDVFELNVHIAYINSYRQVTYINSNNNGDNWSTPKSLLPAHYKTGKLVIAVNMNNIHIAAGIVRERNGKIVADILYIKSADNGMNWSNETDINILPGVYSHPGHHDIAVADEDVYVIYRDNNSGELQQIYYSHSSDNGLTWEKRIQLSNSSHNLPSAPVILSTIAAEGDNVLAVWEDRRNATDGGIELYYRYSSNCGDTWSEEIRLTNAPEYSIQPDIQIGEGKSHLVWSDHREGNYEIFYKHGVLSPSFISAGLEINPETLNLKSKGRWITGYIALNSQYDVNDIDISTVILEGAIPAKWGDIQGDILMVKFDRSDIQDMLSPGTYNLKISGELIDGLMFEGYSNVIKVIRPSKK